MKNLVIIAFLLFSISSLAQQETSLQLGRKQYQEENYGEAIKLFMKAAEEEPGNAQVPYLIGRAYLDMNNNKKAATFLEKAISMDSTKSHWMYECGLIFSTLPDYKKSLHYIQLAGEKGYKKSNDYLENLGNAFMNAGQHEKGIETLNEVLKKKPEDSELMYQIAQANFKAGKYQDAIDMWDKVLVQDNTNAEALYMIGLSYQKKGDKQKGQQLCDKAIQMDPSLKSKRQQMGGGAL